MPSVASTNISNVEWDKDTKDLTVQFRNGAIYAYSSVPKEVYEGLLHAGSAGQYLNQAVKGQYEYRRVA